MHAVEPPTMACGDDHAARALRDWPRRLTSRSRGDTVAVAVEADRNILVTNFGVDPADGTAGLIPVNPQTGLQTVVSAGNLFRLSMGVAVEADGNILVVDLILVVELATGVQTVVSSGSIFNDPVGVAIVSSRVLAVDEISRPG
jgi:hypothetical protein